MTQPLQPPDHPPRPRLAYRIGMVGHRPNRLAAADLSALQRRIADIIAIAAAQLADRTAPHAPLYSPEKPLLRLVTSLAEGADRLLAKAVLEDSRFTELPIDLHFSCPFPFPLAEYERDFLPPAALEADSLTHFRTLLSDIPARAALDIFELDGSRDAAPAAYAAAGRIVVNQSDLLLIVWDGQHQNQIGGTEDMIAFAANAGIPVVWIDAHAPHHYALLPPSFALPLSRSTTPAAAPPEDLSGALPRAIAAALELPSPDPASAESPHAAAADRLISFDDFLAERPPRFRFPALWTAFRTIVGGAPPKHPDPPRPPQAAPAVAHTARHFDSLFAWPDRLAVYYADVYRSAFVAYYFLAAAAVGFALLPLVAGWEGWPARICVIAELLTILAILAIVHRGRRQRWHERWIDYRFAAELIRQVRLTLPLGGGRPFPRLPPHLVTYGHPSATWMTWYVHAAERAFGLPAARLDRPHLLACLDQLHAVLHEQINYHALNSLRCHRIEHRLHFGGLLLLAVTLLACALHLAVDSLENLHWLQPNLLAFLCGFLPAFGAAIVGISNQGEFRRIAKRSRSMQQQLAQLRSRLHHLQTALASPDAPPHQLSSDAATLAAHASRLMVNETLDWRVVLLDRPLELHA